jgi:hypothetical protein
MARSRDDEAARFDVHGAITAGDVDESLGAPICLTLNTFRLAVMRVLAHPFEPATSDLGLRRPVFTNRTCI